MRLVPPTVMVRGQQLGCINSTENIDTARVTSYITRMVDEASQVAFLGRIDD